MHFFICANESLTKKGLLKKDPDLFILVRMMNWIKAIADCNCPFILRVFPMMPSAWIAVHFCSFSGTFLCCLYWSHSMTLMLYVTSSEHGHRSLEKIGVGGEREG